MDIFSNSTQLQAHWILSMSDRVTWYQSLHGKSLTSQLSDSTSTTTTLTFQSLFATLPHDQLSSSIKLKPTNYLTWKTQFAPTIICCNLSNHINGTIAPLSTIINTRKINQNQILIIWSGCKKTNSDKLHLIIFNRGIFFLWDWFRYYLWILDCSL